MPSVKENKIAMKHAKELQRTCSACKVTDLECFECTACDKRLCVPCGSGETKSGSEYEFEGKHCDNDQCWGCYKADYLTENPTSESESSSEDENDDEDEEDEAPPPLPTVEEIAVVCAAVRKAKAPPANGMKGKTYKEKYGLTDEQVDNKNPKNMFEEGDSCEGCGMEFARRRNKHVHAAQCGTRKPRMASTTTATAKTGEDKLLLTNWKKLEAAVEWADDDVDVIAVCEKWIREGEEPEDKLLKKICLKVMKLKLYLNIEIGATKKTISFAGGKRVVTESKSTFRKEHLHTIEENIEWQKE